MKSLAFFISILFISFSSFAQSSNADWLFKYMKKGENIAAKMAPPQHGAYTFGDDEARMIIFSDVTLVHSVQVRFNGDFSTVTIKNEADKAELRKMIIEGAEANAMDTRLILPVEVDGVAYNLSANVPVNPVLGTLEWTASQYSSIFPGLPGFSVKYNRMVSISTDPKSGELVKGDIYQISLGGFLKPKVLVLNVP